MYLSLSLCAFQEKSHSHEKKSPVSLPLSARVLGAHERQRAERENDHTHNTISNASLCFSPPKTREKTLSRSRSRREKETYFFPSLWLLALSEPISFPYIFFHFKKVLLNARCSLLLSLFTHANNSFVKMRRWYTTALLFAHSSE